MAKRVYTKIGDVFSVKTDKDTKKYFQLIAFDLTQLNSDVIRAFKNEYPIQPDLEEILKGKVEFYAHCVVNLGVKLDLWEKVGTSKNIGDLEQILFRDTMDSGTVLGEEPVRISENWYVWKIGGKFKDVGKLTGENRKAELGLVVNPYDIVHRIKTGKYNFLYPGFE